MESQGNIESDFGDYVILREVFKYFTVGCIAIFSIVGTISNIFIIGAVLLERNLKYLGNAFIVNLAIADLLVTAYGFPITMANTLHGSSVLPKKICMISGIFNVYSLASSMQSLMYIAIDRYFAVCHDNLHKRFFNRNLILTMLALTWLEPVIISWPSLIWFFDDHGYDPRSQLCIILYMISPLWYTIYMINFTILTPIFVSFFCYANIFWKVKKSKQRIGVHTTTTASTAASKKSENAIYRTLFVVFALFVAFWTPVAMCILAYNFGFSVPPELYRWCSLLGLGNSIINGFVYGVSNKSFRNGYMKLLRLLCCRSLISRASKKQIDDNVAIIDCKIDMQINK